MRDDGVAVAQGFIGASPVHQIQRDLLDPTQFYFHYKDHGDEDAPSSPRGSSRCSTRQLAILCDSPADVVWWGANFDDMLTYPPYFEQETLAVDPQGVAARWAQRASCCCATPTARTRG